jgi:hypothetical protein
MVIWTSSMSLTFRFRVTRHEYVIQYVLVEYRRLWNIVTWRVGPERCENKCHFRTSSISQQRIVVYLLFFHLLFQLQSMKCVFTQIWISITWRQPVIYRHFHVTIERAINKLNSLHHFSHVTSWLVTAVIFI